MADSPNTGSEGVVRVTVFSNGAQLAEAVQLISITVNRAVNSVPSARIIVADGDIAERKFPVSEATQFKPGARIKINAGYGDHEETVFEGIVVRHGLKITGRNYSRLVIECRDEAVRMTVGRKNANYVSQKDSDIIAKLFAANSLDAQVDSTSVQFGELVQHYCSDWDFVVSRAEVNGLLVIATDGKVSVRAPQVTGSAALRVGYGEDLIEFHADIDARSQFAVAEAVSWDLKAQAAVTCGGVKPVKLNAQGDLDSAELAKVVGLSAYRLQTAAPLEKTALKCWADAVQVKAGLGRICGRMKFQGSAKARVGELIELLGVGARFSGSVFVSGVIHEIADGNWITEVEFGVSPTWFSARPDVTAPPAAGLIPGVEGLQIGVVMKLDGDPEQQQRIQVSVPVLQAQTEGVWARLATFSGSEQFGAFFVPEVGDEVVLGYFNNDPSHPVILGSLYSSKRSPPYGLTAENNTKAIVTRCKAKVEFNEQDKVITVTTPGGNQVVLSDTAKGILLKDQNGSKVELNPEGITLDCPKDIKISARGSVTLDAVGPVSISSKGDLKSAGLNVSCEAQVGFVAKGAASAELSAAGQTVVKGALVMIN